MLFLFASDLLILGKVLDKPDRDTHQPTQAGRSEPSGVWRAARLREADLACAWVTRHISNASDAFRVEMHQNLHISEGLLSLLNEQKPREA